MKSARTIGLAIAFMCLPGIGLASFSRAQQAARGVTQHGRYAESPASAAFPFLSSSEVFNWVSYGQNS